MLDNAYRVIDQQAVQWLGVEAQAAIASTTFVLIAYYALYSIMSAGTLALLSRAIGSNDTKSQQAFMANALIGALSIGLCVLSLSAWLAPMTVQLLGLTGNTAELAQAYLRWHALSCLAQAVMPSLEAIFIAYGRAQPVFWLQLLATTLNIVLNPVCIYYFDLGIGGSALATGIAQLSAAISGIWLLRLTSPFRFKHCLPSRQLGQIAKIGLPMCWGSLMFAGVYWAMLHWVISPLGTSVNAALGIGFSALEGFTWPVFWGFSMGIAGIVGRCLGANQINDALAAIRLAFKWLTAIGMLVGLVFYFGAVYLCSLFTQDAAVLIQAVGYAQILAFSQVFVAYEALAEGVLSGSGQTRLIFYWSAPLNILRIPLSWWFAIHLDFGANAVWWTINASTLLKTLGKWYSVQTGRWQRNID